MTHDPQWLTSKNELLEVVAGLSSSLHDEFCASECVKRACVDLDVSDAAALLDDLIAKVRDDMLAKCIAAVELLHDNNPDQATSFWYAICELRALQEKP